MSKVKTERNTDKQQTALDAEYKRGYSEGHLDAANSRDDRAYVQGLNAAIRLLIDTAKDLENSANDLIDETGLTEYWQREHTRETYDIAVILYQVSAGLRRMKAESEAQACL